MPEYIPSSAEWVRNQVELYERTNGAEGTTLRDSGLPVIIVTNTGSRTGAIRKTPLMRVQDADRYILVGSKGGAPEHPAWVHNLRLHPEVQGDEKARLWNIAVAAFPPYADYQLRTEREIPVFLAEPLDEQTATEAGAGGRP